ncbi:hypothetical protein LR48_Vigan10g148500 [Vigna angularis]|uniref:Putative plant transposon protein domain-containing protein n=1 Tax=Phaseolus angularis TaxID=3914 RepID=A0A0L9VKU3_PHAAN|nr:hypothetical protein LR48_Vigan10g148500 [Vigna angularis]
MTSSSGKRIKTMGNKRKEPERPYSNKFLSCGHEQHFLTVQDRRLLMERKAGWIPYLAPQFGEELKNRKWERIATYPAPANIAVVKEFYTNERPLGDSHTETYMSYVRGKIIRYDPDSINRFLHTDWTGLGLTLLHHHWSGLGRQLVKPTIDSVVEEMRLQSIHRGQVATTEMIIGMYDTPPGRRWTMDEFNNVVAWPEEQAQGSGIGAAEALAIEEDDEDDDDFEDDEEGEEEDSDDSMG